MRTLFLQKPNADLLRGFVAAQAGLDFSYAAVGATASMPPDGFQVDRTRIVLGKGESVFQAATAALRRWQQLRLGWVDVWSPETPLEVGRVVAILGRGVGLWWLNPCRIVYTLDEPGSITRFGFAYGTLPGHVAMGEERFLIEWNRSTNEVSYEILAFSRPSRLLIQLGYPLVRRSQKRFGRESTAAMLRATHLTDAHAASS